MKRRTQRAQGRKPTRAKRPARQGDAVASPARAADDGDLHEGDTIPGPDLIPAGIAPPPPDAPEADEGIVCRTCGCRHFWVLYVRPRPGRVIRRRECRNCGRRITTVEQDAADVEGS